MNIPVPKTGDQSFDSLIDRAFTIQWLSVKAQWEPALIQALVPMAGDCLTLLRRELAALAANPDAPPDWPAITARLAKAWATVVSTRANAAKALFLALARQTVAETGQIITLNGLAGAAPALHQPGQDPRAALTALAAGPAVEHYVKKGFTEFGVKVTAQFRQARAGKLSPEALYLACQPAGRRWAWRLTMLARTTAHEVFNRARRAVVEALR